MVITDVCLIDRSKAAFLAGLCTFLIGHLFYAIGFMDYPTWNGITFYVAAAGVTTMSYLVYRYWLSKLVPVNMRWPVRAYVVVITAMVATAFAVLPDSISKL